MPRLRRRGRGDLKVVVDVMIPTRLYLGAEGVAGEVRDRQRRRDLQRRRGLLLRPPQGSFQVGGFVTSTPITRIFVDSVPEPGGVLELPAGEAHHVLKVLRGRSGDRIEVVDGVGRLFAAELRGGGEAVVLEELAAPDATDVEVSLYQAVPKGGRMDLVVEKATEVGATSIVPLLTRAWRREPARGQGRTLAAGGRGCGATVAQARRARGGRTRTVRGRRLAGGGDRRAPAQRPRHSTRRGRRRVSREPLRGSRGWVERGRVAACGGGWHRSWAASGPYRLRSETAGIVAVARALAALENRIKH